MAEIVKVARTLRVGDHGDLWHGINQFQRETGGEVICDGELLEVGLKIPPGEEVPGPEFPDRRIRRKFAPSRTLD